MKHILLALICLTSLKSVAQKTVTTYYDVFNKHKKETITLNASGQYHGKYTSYFEDGTVSEQRTYLNGKYHGEDKAYFISFNSRGLAYIHNYKNDVKDGLQKNYCAYEGDCYPYVREEEFYKDGYTIWEKYYDEINGKRVLQKERHFDENGYNTLLLEKGYDENGKQVYQIAKDGKNYQDGNASTNRIEFTALNGKKHGLYREWYPSGQLFDSCYYIGDSKEGMEVQYSPTGDIIKTALYHNGLEFPLTDSARTKTDPSGAFQLFNVNGKLFSEGRLIEGKLSGEYKVYFEDGTLFKDCFYKNGLLDGNCRIWTLGKNSSLSGPDYKSVLKSDCNYKAGNLDGLCKTWTWEYVETRWGQGEYQNLLKSVYNYSNGKLDGECSDYCNQQGGIDKRLVYENGILIQRWARNSKPADNEENWSEKTLDDKYYK